MHLLTFFALMLASSSIFAANSASINKPATDNQALKQTKQQLEQKLSARSEALEQKNLTYKKIKQQLKQLEKSDDNNTATSGSDLAN